MARVYVNSVISYYAFPPIKKEKNERKEQLLKLEEKKTLYWSKRVSLCSLIYLSNTTT